MEDLEHSVQSMFDGFNKSLDGEIEQEYSERKQFIGIKIEKNELLVPLHHIEEIILPPKITYVPFSPPGIEGVINLRGSILPVINLRKVLSFQKGEICLNTRIIVFSVGNTRYSVIVDGISITYSVLPQEIESEIPTGLIKDEDLYAGILKTPSELKPILNPEKILSLIFSRIVEKTTWK